MVREVEKYRLDKAGLTFTHSTGSRTKLLVRGWTHAFSLSCPGGDVLYRCGYTHEPQAEHHCVGVLPGELEGHLYVTPSPVSGRVSAKKIPVICRRYFVFISFPVPFWVKQRTCGLDRRCWMIFNV